MFKMSHIGVMFRQPHCVYKQNDQCRHARLKKEVLNMENLKGHVSITRDRRKGRDT